MLFAHFSLAATSAFCAFGLIKGILEVHAGYVTCQNDIPSNSSVGGHILIFTVTML